MKNSMEEKVLRLMQRTAEKEVKRLDTEHNWPDWPPSCTIILHQPKRPQK